MIPYNYISNTLCDDTGKISTQFHIFVNSLRDKLNNVTSATSEINATGDLTIQVNSLYFNNNLWPLELPSTDSVLYRDETEALSWVDPVTLNLEPETGKVEMYYGGTAPTGWVLLNNGTIGSATSGATTRANIDCEDLFLYLWNSFDDTIAPVTGGRGASAAADWAANKKIKLDNLTSRIMSNISGTATHMSKDGDNSYFLDPEMIPAHTHTAYKYNPLDGGTSAPNYYAFRNQWNLNDLSSVVTQGIWTEQFGIYDSRYDNVSHEEFSVEQPSTNINLIIKL